MTWLQAMSAELAKGRKATEFSKEIKELTLEDRNRYWELLRDAGVQCDKPQPPRVNGGSATTAGTAT